MKWMHIALLSLGLWACTDGDDKDTDDTDTVEDTEVDTNVEDTDVADTDVEDTDIEDTDAADTDAPPDPPQEAIDACTGKAEGDACTITFPDGGTEDGTCETHPTVGLACRPANPPAP